MGLDLDVDSLIAALEIFAAKSEQAINLNTQASALSLERYAKENKPWTDRSGQAKQRLQGRSKKSSEYTWEITLSHGVDYGIYLEFAHEKKYAIIFPTINLKSPEVIQNFTSMIDGLSKNL